MEVGEAHNYLNSVLCFILGAGKYEEVGGVHTPAHLASLSLTSIRIY